MCLTEEVRSTNRYKLVKRCIRLGRLEELRKRLEEVHISTKESFEKAAKKWLSELDEVYGKEDERLPWAHTEEEQLALMKKMEYPHMRVQCPRCGKELLWKTAGNSIMVECATPYCIYTGVRGL